MKNLSLVAVLGGAVPVARSLAGGDIHPADTHPAVAGFDRMLADAGGDGARRGPRVADPERFIAVLWDRSPSRPCRLSRNSSRHVAPLENQPVPRF